MSFACAIRVRSAYETGRLAPGDTRLFRPGGLELTARAIALARLQSGARLIDLGCGAGDTVVYLNAQGFHAVGVDCSTDSAAPQACRQKSFPGIVAPAEDLPFPDGFVDGIVAECSLSLFEDRQRAVAECARVLVDGGRLIISDLYARRPEAMLQVRALVNSCAANMLVLEELQSDLLNANFTVEVCEDHSRTLRECAARYLFEHGTLDGLWGCGGDESSSDVQSALRAARAGYFLLVATRRNRFHEKGDGSHE